VAVEGAKIAVVDAVGGGKEAEPGGVGLGRGIGDQVEEVGGGPGGLACQDRLAGAPGVERVEEGLGLRGEVEGLGEVGEGGHGRGSGPGGNGGWLKHEDCQTN
jgi:hypothetical protein